MQHTLKIKKLQLIIISSGLLVLFQFCNYSHANKATNKTNTSMKFSTSFCNPLKPDIVQLGDITQEQVVAGFEKVNWNEYLQKMNDAKDDKVYYSPSFEVHNIEIKHGLAISAVGDPKSRNYCNYLEFKKVDKRCTDTLSFNKTSTGQRD